jgi:hypothetical protein
MSVIPTSRSADDQAITRYLLGLLSDEDTERLDEASIADEEFVVRLRVVENDLVDAYVRGALAGEMLERFESHYLASPRRQEQVRFAGRFLRAVDDAAVDTRDPQTTPPDAVPEPDDARVSEPSSSDEVPQRLRLAPRFLAAAAVLLLAASAALLFEAGRLRSGLTAARQENVALDRRARELAQRLDEQRAAAATAIIGLDRVRESAAPGAPPSASAPTDAGVRASTTQAPTMALVLLPQTRAIGPIPTLILQPNASGVALALQLESNDSPQYRATLRDPASNEIVWTSDPIAATSDQTSIVSVLVPASVLKPQHYSVALRADGGDVVASYAFQIVRR